MKFIFQDRILFLLSISIKSISWFLFGFLIFVTFYFSSAWILGIIPANANYRNSSEGIPIYISSNGVHTDIFVPAITEEFNWENYIYPADFEKSKNRFQYISFGWGDKGFYLGTPTWAELKVSVALNAVFLPSSTAMHVSYYDDPPIEDTLTIKFYISHEQYKNLIAYILSSFQRDSSSKFIRIPCCGYEGMNDNFYEANGYYHLFYTCNSWTNEALKIIGIRTAIWAPFDIAILYQLRKSVKK